MRNDDIHGDEYYTEVDPLEEEIMRMQEEIDDLRGRMNAVCAFLSMRYPDDKEALTFGDIMIDYENKTIHELMTIYNPIFESREDSTDADYNEVFCEWLYDQITSEDEGI